MGQLAAVGIFRKQAYLAALDAARDAVENVPDAIFQQAAWVRHTDALAAIDALRD
jgi:hypothetical protein